MLPARPIVFPSRTYNFNQGAAQVQNNAPSISQPPLPQPIQQSSLPVPSVSLSLNPPGAHTQPSNGSALSQVPSYSTENKPVASTSSVVPATPQPLTLEQQHITAVDGMVPTLQYVL